MSIKVTHRSNWLVFALVALIFSDASYSAEPSHKQPLSKSMLAKSSSIETLVLPNIDVVDLQTKSANQLGIGTPLKFAQVHGLTIDPSSVGSWEAVTGQGAAESIWRYRLYSPDGLSINLGFGKYNMPVGGRMFLYADDYEQQRGPFTEANNKEHGEFWAPIIKGKTITIEINIPTIQKDALELELNYANQGFVDFENARRDLSFVKSGSCNVDVACSQANDWRDQVRSVGAYSVNGAFSCSGASINNTARNGRPYFLTAEHCNVTHSNDQTVVVYWNYENSSCRPIGGGASGGAGDGSLAIFNLGTKLIAESENTDFLLLELEDAFNPAANIFLAGWSQSSNVPNSAVGIHHPGVEEK